MLVGTVRQACGQPLEAAPHLDELLPDALPSKKGVVAAPKGKPMPVALPQAERRRWEPESDV